MIKKWTSLSTLLLLAGGLIVHADQLKPVDNLKTYDNNPVAGWSLADNWRIEVTGKALSANTRFLHVLQRSRVQFTATIPSDNTDPVSSGVVWVVDGPGPFVWMTSTDKPQQSVATCVVSGRPPFGSVKNQCAFCVTAYTVNYNTKMITNYFWGWFTFECLPTDFNAPTVTTGHPGSYTAQFGVPDAKTNLQALPSSLGICMQLTMKFDRPPKTPKTDVVSFTISGNGSKMEFLTTSPLANGGVDYHVPIDVGTTVRGYQAFWDTTQIAVNNVTNDAKLVSAKLTVY